ncbi:MAG: hypothetical protein GDA51_12395 [Ekhidna sp.]|nr:hypothetical protein [Ekhidna sp.]
MKYLVVLIIIGLMSGCQQTGADKSLRSNEAEYKQPAHHIDALTEIFKAHGGYEQWDRMKTLSYKKEEETTITHLKNRKIRLESPDRVIGFDGENVWVTPDSADASNARFYHNLFFYFYAMPFVVGDPGANYEVLEKRELKGKAYNRIKIGFNQGVGDAPDDNYIIFSDPETNRMEWLMYTVTYRSGKPGEKYNLINYKSWEEFNSLILPTAIEWYQFQNDSVGGPRSEVVFENIEILESAPDPALFEMPEGAQIAPR